MENIFCPVHKDVREDIDRIERKQEARLCIAHEVQIKSLEKNNEGQWREINKMKRLVYVGVGIVWVAAFLGSTVGNLLMVYLQSK